MKIIEAITKKGYYLDMYIILVSKDENKYIAFSKKDSSDGTVKKGKIYLLETKGMAEQPYIIKQLTEIPTTSIWIWKN